MYIELVEKEVKKLHKLLDPYVEPCNSDTPCSDPECYSKLYHRLKILLADLPRKFPDAVDEI